MKVVVVVEGGCLCGVFASPEADLDVELVDCDNLREELSVDDIDRKLAETTKGLQEKW